MRNRLKTASSFAAILLLTLSCRDSVAPIPDAPYALALGSNYNSVVLIRSDGSGANFLSCPVNCRYEWAKWSKDGTKLALEAVAVVNGAFYSALYTANADGSNPIEIDSAPSFCGSGRTGGSCTQIFYHHFDPDWSADGRLAYARDTAIVASDFDGSNKKVIVTPLGPSGQVRQVRWGPDDRTITFVGGEPALLYSVNAADGLGLRQMSDVELGYYAWAPDGQSIGIISLPNSNLQASFYLIDPAKGTAKELVSGTGAWAFSWSPSSDAITFSSSDSLFVADRTGHLTLAFVGEAGFPQWSPDGRDILITGNCPGVSCLSAVRRTTGVRRVVTAVPEITAFSVSGSPAYNGFFMLNY